MADDITPIDISVIVQMKKDAHAATWSFANKESGNAAQVKLYMGQKYRVTYKLHDASSWSLDALSLRKVSNSNAGFVTLTRGQTTKSQQPLPDGAGTLTVEVFDPDTVILNVKNELTSGSAPLALGLSFTVSAKNSQETPKQSSQDPQMVLEPTPPPPPTL